MASITINIAADVTSWGTLTIQALNAESTILLVETFSGVFDVDWGDGNIQNGNISGNSLFHTFASTSNAIRLRTPLGLGNIKRISFIGTEGAYINATALSVFSLLETYECTTVNSDFIGTLLQINRGLKHLILRKASLSGDIIDAPDLLTFSLNENNVNNNITATVANLPRTLINLTLEFFSRTALIGDIQDLPPNIVSFIIRASSSNIIGNILNLPISLVTFIVTRNSTITGNISNFSNNIVTFILVWPNSIFGTINDIPVNLINISINNNNGGITGDLKDIKVPTNTSYALSLLNSESVDYTNGLNINQPTSFITLNLKYDALNPPLTSANLDQLLIDLNSSTFYKPDSTLNITGTTAPIRTSASDSAYNALIATGMNITLNT